MNEQTTKEKIAASISAGEQLTATELADKFGISRQRTYQILRSLGAKPLRKVLPGRPAGKHTIDPPVVTGGIPVLVSPTIGGRIAEVLVVADLLARGFKPFTPVVGNAVFDVLAVCKVTGRVITFDAKTGRVVNGKVMFNKAAEGKRRHCNTKPDHYAVVCKGEPVIYVPPLDGDGKCP